MSVKEDAPGNIAPSVSASVDPRVDIILDLIAKETALDRASLKLDVSTDDLGISSLDVTLAIFSIEKHFDIDILSPLEASNDGPLTLGLLIDHIIALLPAAGQPSPHSTLDTPEAS